LPDPVEAHGPEQLVAVLAGLVYEQAHGRAVGLLDHRRERVDVANGDAFGEAAVDEQHFGQAPAAQVFEGGGDRGAAVPQVVLGAELDGIHEAGHNHRHRHRRVP
jgi:hypothetical protein